MNLEKTYYVTQIVAVFCLVCSLIYVALQVSQNTREMRISAFREEAVQMIDLFLLEAQDPELLDLIVRAETDFESLQPFERRRAMGYATAWLLNSNASYETVLQGLRPDILEGMTEGSRQRLCNALLLRNFRAETQHRPERISGFSRHDY
jgi:hypothetical protein